MGRNNAEKHDMILASAERGVSDATIGQKAIWKIKLFAACWKDVTYASRLAHWDAKLRCPDTHYSAMDAANRYKNTMRQPDTPLFWKHLPE